MLRPRDFLYLKDNTLRSAESLAQGRDERDGCGVPALLPSSQQAIIEAAGKGGTIVCCPAMQLLRTWECGATAVRQAAQRSVTLLAPTSLAPTSRNTEIPQTEMQMNVKRRKFDVLVRAIFRLVWMPGFERS